MQPQIAFFAKFLHPSRGAALKLGMVSVLPGASDILQGTNLLKTSQLLLCRLCEKLASAALANQAVDFAHQGFGNNDVSSSRAHLKSHLSLTDCGMIFKTRWGCTVRAMR